MGRGLIFVIGQLILPVLLKSFQFLAESRFVTFQSQPYRQPGQYAKHCADEQGNGERQRQRGFNTAKIEIDNDQLLVAEMKCQSKQDDKQDKREFSVKNRLQGRSTRSRICLPGLKYGTYFAASETASPDLGLRPTRGVR